MKPKNPHIEKELRMEIKKNMPLKNVTAIGIGGPARYWITPRNNEELKRLFEYFNRNKTGFIILGKGTNTLCPDSGAGFVINLSSGDFGILEREGDFIISGAGVPLARCIRYSIDNSLSGLEGLIGIPGSVGGAVFMNAGYKIEIKDLIDEIDIMDRNGRVFRKKSNELNYSYRNSSLNGFVVLRSRFKLKRKKKKDILKKARMLMIEKNRKQPLEKMTAGSIFKNPENSENSAARLIEECGFKGFKVGNVSISLKHANFLVNCGNATSRDAKLLINFVRKGVRSRFGVNLELEMCII